MGMVVGGYWSSPTSIPVLVESSPLSIYSSPLQEFEKTQVLHRRAMARVPEVTGALRACEVPNSVKEAEHLMQEDLKLKENLVNKIAEAELNIDRLLSVLKGQGAEESVEVGSEYISMREALMSMMKDLRASQGQFDSFWTSHKTRVDHMMRMCHFKKTAEKVGVVLVTRNSAVCKLELVIA